MDFNHLFTLSEEDNHDELFEHVNIRSQNTLSLEDDEFPEPPEPPSFGDDSGGGDNDSGGDSGGDYGGDDNGGDSGGDSGGGDSYGGGGSGGDSGTEIEKNVSPNPLALIHGRQELHDRFVELRESVARTIEILSTHKTPRTVEINRLKDLKEAISKNSECVFTQPINESLQIFGVMTHHYSNIVKLIGNITN